MKKDNVLEIKYNLGYIYFDMDFLNDYWCISSYKKNTFTYTCNQLMLKYKINSNSKIHTFAKACGYLELVKLLDCGNCTRIFKIYQRKDIGFEKEDWFKEQLICVRCKNEKINFEVKEKIRIFRELIPLVEKYQVFPPSKDLRYLEKIFLYVLMSKLVIKEDNSINLHQWQDFQAIEINGLEDVLKGIRDKGYIYFSNAYDHILIRQNELKKFNDNLSAYLSYDNQRELKETLSLNFYNDIFIVFPEGFENIEDWILKLFNDISNYEPKFEDFKEIEEYLVLKRLGEVYALIDYVCRNRKIPIKKTNALELDLLRMLKKYDLRSAWSIIFYQAKQAASELYDMEHNEHRNARFTREFVFPHYISSYLDYLESKNQNPKYPKNLPENWVYSEIELFISASIIGHYQKWDKYTPSQIQTMWYEATKASDEDILDIYEASR